MKILVCINQVPDATSKINFSADNTSFDPIGIQFVINPSDEAALTKALQIKEQTGATVTIAHIGTVESEPNIRKAFALGADAMLRVDAEPLDGFFVAEQLANIAQEYDIIFCGKESLDYNGGIVGGVLATLLNINFVDDVTNFSVQENEAEIEREIDGGKQKLTSPLPVLVAVQKELVNEEDIRIPSMKGIMNARKTPIQVLPAVGTQAKTKVVLLEKPPVKEPVKMISPDNLDELIEELHNKRKLF
ncbi:MAG: electron transfer flavoprotein subunit beta/FixA family protein [Capnocytophaga sp.]|nr:electron transfer flavoprotein subunit beta/FixA family protein [Capnocytophaga sp.]